MERPCTRCDRSMAQQWRIKRIFRSAQGRQAARCSKEVRLNPTEDSFATMDAELGCTGSLTPCCCCFYCRYGAVLPAAAKQKISNTGALRYYEYTLLGAQPQPHCVQKSLLCSSETVSSHWARLAGYSDDGRAGEECFLFHVVNPACGK